MTIRWQLVLAFFGVTLFVAFGISFVSYRLEKDTYIEGVDRKLYAAAVMAREIMSPSYHDALVDETSIDEAEYLRIIDRYNRLCTTLGLQYLWSNMVVGDDIVFTSSTSTSKDVSQGDHALFFDVHSDPEAFEAVLARDEPTFSTFHNEWGDGRMVLVPYRDAQGRRYVFGASISIAELEDRLEGLLLSSLWIFLVALGLGSVASFAISRRLTRSVDDLSALIARITEGDYREALQTPKAKGEIRPLEVSIAKMRAAVQRHEDDLIDLVHSREEELREHRGFLANVVNHTRDGIVTLDREWKITTINPAAQAMLRCVSEEVVGMPIADLIDAEERADFENMLEGLADDADAWNVHRARRLDGSELALEVGLSVMPLGSETHYVALLRDVTARVEAERALRAAKEEADRASAAKTRFLSNISHELRTPLNAVVGFCQLLSDHGEGEPLSERQRECVRQIDKGSTVLLELIDDLLDLTKIEAGELPIELASVDASRLVDECAALVRPLAEERRIQIATPKGGTRIVVRADAIRLKQCLFNLLSNAIKYSPMGATIEVEVEERDDERCRIAVVDRGIGIEDGKKHEVFTRFRRLSAGTQAASGSGIGLSLTKELVELMGGRLGVISAEGRGSRFWVELERIEPLADAEENDTKDVGARRSTSPLPPRELRGRVLYVEDDPVNVLLMRRIIERIAPTGVDLDTVPSAEEGIRRATEAPPDLIFMDLNLAGELDGFEALDALRRRGATKEIPIVAVTASAEKGASERGRAEGFDEYLEKPFRIEDIAAVLRQTLR